MPFGTDAPVEPFDPWPGLACAVTRAATGVARGHGAVRPAGGAVPRAALAAACVDPPSRPRGQSTAAA